MSLTYRCFGDPASRDRRPGPSPGQVYGIRGKQIGHGPSAVHARSGIATVAGRRLSVAVSSPPTMAEGYILIVVTLVVARPVPSRRAAVPSRPSRRRRDRSSRSRRSS